MDFTSLLIPLIITILLCFISGFFIRLYFSGKSSFQMQNQWWKHYVMKMMVIWGRLLLISFVGSLVFGWINGIVNLPQTNFLYITLQYLATILSGIAVTILQCYFVGFGFLIIPFNLKQEINTEHVFEKAQKKIFQMAVWVIFSVLLLSILVDWMMKFF